jgi:uncharacterized protein YjbI with pentapeptide repeats
LSNANFTNANFTKSNLEHYYLNGSSRNDKCLFVPRSKKVATGCFCGSVLTFFNKCKKGNKIEYIDSLKLALLQYAKKNKKGKFKIKGEKNK